MDKRDERSLRRQIHPMEIRRHFQKQYLKGYWLRIFRRYGKKNVPESLAESAFQSKKYYTEENKETHTHKHGEAANKEKKKII